MRYKNNVADMVALKEQGMSQSQIAEELGVPLGVVAGCLARRRKAAEARDEAALREMEDIREPWVPVWPKDEKVHGILAQGECVISRKAKEAING